MAIINSYPNDINIQDKDAWIGTDSQNRQTKQYTAEAIAKYLNIKGKVSIGGQINYKFVDTPFDGSGTMAFAAGNGDGTPFSNITEFKIFRNDLSGQRVVEWISYLVGDQILIASQDDVSSFGHYTVLSYTIDPNEINFYTLELAYIGSNGGIIVDNYYDIVNFSLAGATDKTFVYTQGTPASSWTIQHNLNKFPSVTAVNANNIQGFGEVCYIDANNLIINFSAGFSGKAYLN